ncbi:MAG: hypothetical protein ACXWWD_13415 [Chitinophagaceae bacterium]
MKKILVISFIVITNNILAQEKINATNQFSVQGKIKNQLNFSQNDLTAFASHFIDSVVIYNHLMQPRKTIKKYKRSITKGYSGKSSHRCWQPETIE